MGAMATQIKKKLMLIKPEWGRVGGQGAARQREGAREGEERKERERGRDKEREREMFRQH